MMKTKLLLFVSLFFLSALAPSEGQAASCKSKTEQVVVLKEPKFEDLTVWDMAYGGEGVEQIADIVVAHNDGDTFTENSYTIAGDYTKHPKDQILRPFLAHIDRNGKVLWEQKSDGRLRKTVTKLVKTKDGYAVLGSLTNSKKWRGFYIERFNKKGELLSRTPVYGNNYHVDASGIVETKDQKGFVVSAFHEQTEEGAEDQAALYRIDNDGALVWRRRYGAGRQMKFNNVQLLPNGFYAVTGSMKHIKTDQILGMLLLMNEDGTKGWQQQYVRGDYTTLKKVITLPDENMILIGGTVPAGSDKESGMIMKVGPRGSMIWRRFYIGNYRYVVEDVVSVLNDRILVMVDGYPESALSSSSSAKPTKGHTQIVTLSSRGDMLGVENFTSGANAHVSRIIEGDKREHIIVGTTEISAEIKPTGEKVPPQFNGWVFAARLKHQSFEDLCAPSK